MKRTRLGRALDVIKVDDADQIHALANDERIDRVFDLQPTLNAIILRKTLGTLSYRGQRFPTMTRRGNAIRATQQDQLWDRCNAKAAGMAEGPDVLLPLAGWVQGHDVRTDPGILVQQVVGSIFSETYVATTDSWAAAVTLDNAIRSGSLVKMLWWKVTGKVTRAKRLLASLVNNDLAGVHGTGVALHNIVASIRLMRQLYLDQTSRNTLTPEDAVRECLMPPPVVLRQATAEGTVSGCPFAKYSLLLLELGAAYKKGASVDMVFMNGSWSRCPAEQWVPAVLAGVWKRAAMI
ncbi:MAG TPA: hypothetical protein VNS58_30615 [Puia sp.]|nr:hypothetical protein [Puia sp.]